MSAAPDAHNSGFGLGGRATTKLTQTLMPISKTVVKRGIPLEFSIYTSDGTLLADKGISLTDAQAILLSKRDRLFTKKSELLAALQAMRVSSNNIEDSGAYKGKTPFAILKRLEQDLEELISHQDSPMALANITAAAARVQNICNQWPDAALAKIFLDDKQKYTVQHSIHTAIICDLASRHLNWQENIRNSLVGAALTMNISLGFLQDELQNQKATLTDAQQDLLKKHPIESANILDAIGITDTLWLEVIRTHHENADGSGYPFGLEKDFLPTGSQLLSLADMYGAKISGRKYRNAILPTDAARYFFNMKDQRDYGVFIEVLLKITGLYPPGSIVKLASGETAVVVKKGAKINHPLVRALTNRQGQKLGTPIARNTSQPQYAIASFSDLPGDFGDIDFDALWGFTS